MNLADKMGMEARLKGNLADWMETHGKVLSDRRSSNAYAGFRVREIAWRGDTYRLTEVDGMTCQIERI